MIVLKTYIATLSHDNGKAKIRIVSLSGKKGAISQIMAAESCPASAILKLKKVKSKKVGRSKDI